jgi:hypothetical protein
MHKLRNEVAGGLITKAKFTNKHSDYLHHVVISHLTHLNLSLVQAKRVTSSELVNKHPKQVNYQQEYICLGPYKKTFRTLVFILLISIIGTN